MTLRNPSERARLEAEREELLDDLKGYYPKAHKQSLINQIHEIERILELPLTTYNGK